MKLKSSAAIADRPDVRITVNRAGGGRRLAVFRRDVPYLVMLLIPTAFFLIFKYWPMFGLAMAFQNYKVGSPFIGAGANWVGLKWFRQLFGSPLFGRLIKNTLAISSLSLIISFPFSILFAVLINEIVNRKLKTFTSNISLLPYFISTVVIVGVMFNFFSVDDGVFNTLRAKLGGGKIDFMGTSRWFRTMYIGSDVWQYTGFNSVVFTAAISGIDPTLYEAAAIDGSSRFKNIFHITLPCIMPTIIIMFILRIGRLLSVGYEKIILMYSPGVYDVADTLSTYSYRAGILDGKLSLSTAIGLFDSVCNLILLLAANRISKKFSETSLW